MKICLWRYTENTRNYPGHHLSADRDGCRFLRERLLQIRGHVTIPLRRPDPDVLAVPNNQGGQAGIATTAKWRLETDRSMGAAHFVFQERGSTLLLEASLEQIQCILKGVEDIQEGRGDYCIGGDGDHILWFWWQV